MKGKNRSGPRRKMGLVALSLMAGVALAQEPMPAMPPAQVEIARAEIRDMAPTVDVSGEVISLNDSRIATEVEGVLIALAQVGDEVEAGGLLARIDPRLMQVALKQAEAAVARLEADLRFREQQLERAENLARSNNAAANQLDESRAQRDMVRHELADARARLERAKGDLERTELRAPFAGHVTERLASLGEYVAVGEDVLRLVDTHRIEISLPAPLALTRFLRPGLELEVRSGERRGRHAVRAVVPVGDAQSRMAEVRLASREGDWLVGTPVQVRIPSASPVTSVAVPRDALVQRGGESYVYRVGDDGSAQQIRAQITAVVGLWVGVSEGIEAGDRVIIRGAERLAPGQPVQIKGNADSPAGP